MAIFLHFFDLKFAISAQFVSDAKPSITTYSPEIKNYLQQSCFPKLFIITVHFLAVQFKVFENSLEKQRVLVQGSYRDSIFQNSGPEQSEYIMPLSIRFGPEIVFKRKFRNVCKVIGIRS